MECNLVAVTVSSLKKKIDITLLFDKIPFLMIP